MPKYLGKGNIDSIQGIFGERMKHLCALGCALVLYKPHLVKKLHKFLDLHYGSMEYLLTCCGDTFYGILPTEQVIGKMKAKAAEMPEASIIVYCVTGSKSMFIGEKRPRYLIDLWFAEDTVPKTLDPDRWHEELDEFIGAQALEASHKTESLIDIAVDAVASRCGTNTLCADTGPTAAPCGAILNPQ